MKKVISLILCLMLVLSFSACGKKSDSTSDKGTVAEQKSDVKNKSEEDASDDKTKNDTNKKSDNVESDDGSSEVNQLPVESAEQLEGMVNEFNNTEDPERKEELRKQLEEILKQAEQLSEQG